MAFSKVATTIANPARRNAGRKKNMAKRRLSAKQLKYFGTKRQKAAAKSRRRKTSVKRHRPAAKRAGARKPNPAANPKRKKRRYPRKPHAIKRTPKRRTNTGEILVLTAGNPARRKSMAKKRYTKRKKRASAKRPNPAGRRSKKSYSRRMRRGNPGAIGRPMDWVKGGVGVLAGIVGTRGIPQLVAPAANTGPTGYAMNGVTALGLGFVAHMFTKDKVITAAVVAGGFAALIQRVINDQSTVGKYLAMSGATTGMGDYLMVTGNTQPQRILDPDTANFELMGSGGPMGAAAVMRRNGEDGSGNC
jgi:hypothetical protein